MYTTLIPPADLYRNYQRPDWVIVDCRFDLADTEAGRRAYREAHIPGARYAHLDDELSGEIVPGTTGRHPLPAADEAARVFGRWGIDDEVQVIVYDDKGGGIAARLWWMLRWLGHEAVAVLDGGWQAWQSAGYPVDQKTVRPQARTFTARVRHDLLVDAADVERFRRSSEYVVVDSRTPSRYRGEEEPIDPIAGHIPGAINLPFADNLTAGHFRSTDELGHRFEKAIGNKDSDQVIFYCGSGVTACHNILAFQHAGKGEARLYPGSWSEWITDPRREVASAPAD